ncbi:MAG: hypothetical protein KCHDKBKB_01345 [Elusimicrobia bacterium]|nr:hypothetical protein [Elusimicrobiota bacterium]
MNYRKFIKAITPILGGVALLCMTSSVGVAGPCDADLDKFCFDVQPGQGQLENCINSQRHNFTSQCRSWLTKMERSLKRIGSACSESARAYCRDVRPGYQRVKNCLMDNFDKLPEDCQRALNETGQ